MYFELRRFVFHRVPFYLILVFLLLPFSREFAESNTWYYAGYLLLISFLATYLFVPFVFKGAEIFDILDKPDQQRKVHKHTTPLTGGISIYFGFALTILLNFNFTIQMKAILVASFLIFVTGVLDDARGLSAKLRLLIQLLACGILMYFGIRITFIPDYLGGIYVEILITLLWILGITNAMNFIDGLDGLATGLAIIYAIFFGIIAVLTNQLPMMYLSIAVAGACSGFLPYNFRPKGNALIFLGDSGSTTLGFLLASFGLMGEWGDMVIDLAVPVLIMSVLIFDMALTTVMRVWQGEVTSFREWLAYTGRDHFHHRLSIIGLGPKKTTIFFYLISISFGLSAITVLFTDWHVSLLVIAHAVLTFFIIGVILVFGTDKQVKKQRAQQTQKFENM